MLIINKLIPRNGLTTLFSPKKKKNSPRFAYFCCAQMCQGASHLLLDKYLLIYIYLFQSISFDPHTYVLIKGYLAGPPCVSSYWLFSIRVWQLKINISFMSNLAVDIRKNSTRQCKSMK